MLAAEIIDKITSAGGQIWVVEDRIRARLPKDLRSMVEEIRSRKPELIAELARRPAMPAGVRLIRWAPKDAPFQLSPWETVTDIDKFTFSTLRQVEARLHGKGWRAGNWTLSALIDRLSAIGCHVALIDPKAALQ